MSVIKMKTIYIILFLILIWKNFGWIFTTNFEKKTNIENVVTVKHIIFGYKIFDQYYFDFNYFLAILGFSIYSTKHIMYLNKRLSKSAYIIYLWENILLE